MPGTPAAPALRSGEVLLNFQAADLQAVVKAVSDMTGRNFLIDPRVKGQITIISARPVSVGAAYQIFLSALKAQGFTAVEGVGAVHVIPVAEAKANADVIAQGEPGGGEHVVTHVLVMQHGAAAQMIPLLRPLMSPTSQLSSYDPANALIITDYADNIRRLLQIVEKLDQPSTSDVAIIPLTHASALDVADVATRLSLVNVAAGPPGQPIQPGGRAGDRFVIVPYLRTNSLLLLAESPSRIDQLRSLIAKLDVPAVMSGETRVIYLRNADAVTLAEVLRGLLAGEARASLASPTAPPVGSPSRPPAAGSSGGRIEPSLIQADEATNALVISAPDAVYNNLRGVIEKLDVRRAQVYVEALIVEMTTDLVYQLGVQWAAGIPAGSGSVGAATNFPSANPSLFGAVASPTSLVSSGGLLLGYLGRQITLPDGTVTRSLGALARALEQNNMANILSSPNIMMLDNAEAKIVVGQNVPFLTGSYAQASAVGTGTAATVNPFQTIERKDVGLMLKIKPQVTEGGTVKLNIVEEVSSIAPAAVAGAADLVTNKRSLETRVLVDDGSTIILGGLIQESANETVQRVPLLGSLPLIGNLFRYKETTKSRTNLMVFLRPVIVRQTRDSYNLTADRYQYLRGQAGELPLQEILDRFTPPPPPDDAKVKPAPAMPEVQRKPGASSEPRAAPAPDRPQAEDPAIPSH